MAKRGDGGGGGGGGGCSGDDGLANVVAVDALASVPGQHVRSPKPERWPVQCREREREKISRLLK